MQKQRALTERVCRMELYFDTLHRALQENVNILHDPPLCAMLDTLTAYYDGGQWLLDYEADERGELPPNLKRGVLSQDGLYELFEKVQKEYAMKTEKLIELIDKTLVEIWTTNIQEDYKNEWLLLEDSLKCALYYHLRSRLGKIFEENGIRIYTEYTGKPFGNAHKKPDMVIAYVDTEMECDYLQEAVGEILAVIEIKFKNGFNLAATIYNDYEKLKYYVQELGVSAKLYMATIWEHEDAPTSWERQNAAWAKGRLMELNASYKKESNYEMQFYVCQH